MVLGNHAYWETNIHSPVSSRSIWWTHRHWGNYYLVMLSQPTDKIRETDMFFYFELWVPVSPQFLFDTFMDLVKGKRSSVTHAMSRPVKVPPPPKVRHLSHDYNPSYIPTALDPFILNVDTLYPLNDHNWGYFSCDHIPYSRHLISDLSSSNRISTALKTKVQFLLRGPTP